MNNKQHLHIFVLILFIYLFLFSSQAIAQNSSDEHFKDNEDKTVTDTRTGLIWSKSANPLSGSGDLDWHQAKEKAEASSLAGYTNWRLPTKNELNDFLPGNTDDNIAVEMSRIFDDLPSNKPRLYWTGTSVNNKDAYLFSFSIDVSIDDHSTSISINKGEANISKSEVEGTAWIVRNDHPQDPVTKERADFLFNWLESQFPEILRPQPQTTQGSDGNFYRNYSGSVSVKTIKDYLFYIDQQGKVHDLGDFLYWLDYAKAETIFNWLEAQPQLKDILAPTPQKTQSHHKAYFYRYYPDTRFYVYTYQGSLYYIDNKGTTRNLGLVDDWLKDIDN